MDYILQILIHQNIFGLIPTHNYHLIFPLITLVIWLLFYPFAWLRKIRIIHKSSLRASWVEEIIFRGFIYGIALYFFKNVLIALAISTFLFGLVHIRNYWWAGWLRAMEMVIYNMFVAGIIFGVIRILTGDIYLGILIHFLHNLFVLFTVPQLAGSQRRVPNDGYLKGLTKR